MTTRPRVSRAALTALMLLWTAIAPLLTHATVAVAQTVAAQTALETKPQPSTMLIFDGSGSMWGKLDGEKQIKLAQARDGVKAALAKFTVVSSQIGLVSFGHRRQGDCSDVQVIAPPEPATEQTVTDRIVNPLEKLNPKGKGPLTAALREAAKTLGKGTGPRSIVLIHDDPDNCQQDACAAVGELQQTAPGVVIHVVGLGLKPDDALRYQCLTRPTGGKHVNAQDAAQIAAGVVEVMQLAALGVGEAAAATAATAATAAKVMPVPAATQAAVPVVVAPVAPAVDLTREGPSAIRLRALLAKDRLVAPGHRIGWTISADPPRDGQPASADAEGSDLVLPALPGAYKVRAVSGLVQAETTVTVAAKGQALAEVVFNAGDIRIKAPLAADATVMVAERDPATPVAGKAAPKGAASGRRLGVWPHGQTNLLVPARALILTLEQSELRSAWPIDIAAGEIREVDVGQAGGRVVLDLLPAAGPANVASNAFGNQPVVYTIEEDDPDAPRGRREIARSAASTAEFVVAPGTYMIAASRNGLEARERIAVVAGEVVRRSLPLVASRLVMSARLGKAPAAPTDRIVDSFRLMRVDVDNEAALILPGPAVIVDVPPGRYRVEARRNNAAIRVEQVVDVKAGEYKAVALEYQAGELRMDTAFASEPGTWRILDARGRLVGSGTDAETRQLLTAGRYTVRIDIAGKRREQGIDVRSGEVSSLRLQ